MAKVMFTISYQIVQERREEYLALSRKMKEHLTKGTGKNYNIFEQKGKKNSFTEVFLCESMEEYDQLEDQDETTTQLINQLEPLLANGKMKYTTLVELS